MEGIWNEFYLRGFGKEIWGDFFHLISKKQRKETKGNQINVLLWYTVLTGLVEQIRKNIFSLSCITYLLQMLLPADFCLFWWHKSPCHFAGVTPSMLYFVHKRNCGASQQARRTVCECMFLWLGWFLRADLQVDFFLVHVGLSMDALFMLLDG